MMTPLREDKLLSRHMIGLLCDTPVYNGMSHDELWWAVIRIAILRPFEEVRGGMRRELWAEFT